MFAWLKRKDCVESCANAREKIKDKREKKSHTLFSDSFLLFCLFFVFKITWFQTNFFLSERTLKIIIYS